MIKNKLNKTVAFLCILVLAFTSVTEVNRLQTVRATDTNVSEITPVYLSGFRNITLSSFKDSSGNQIEDKIYNKTTAFYMKNLQGQSLSGFDRTLLSMKVTFQAADGSSRIEFAGKNANSAFYLHPTNDGANLKFSQSSWSNPMAEDPYNLLDAEKAGVTSFLNTELLLQISIEYGNYDTDDAEDDVRIGFYFNGQLYDGKQIIITNCNISTMFGGCFTVYCDGSSVEVSSIIPENKMLTELTWSDYQRSGAQDAARDQIFPISEQAWVHRLHNSDVVNMASTKFQARVTFKGSYIDNAIRYAGTQGERGIFIYVGSNENLWIGANSTINLGLTDALVFDKNIAGVGTFLNQEFVLGITTDFADYDGGGIANDVQLGFYFNGNLYNNQYLYAYDCIDDFGDYLTIYSGSSNTIVRSMADEAKEITQHLWTDGAYALDSDGEQDALINGVKTKEAYLDIPGDYMITDGDSQSITKLVLYSEGDAHPDDMLDIRDLVAAIKVTQGTPLDNWAGTLAVYADEMDADATRERLLNGMGIEESHAVSMDFLGGKDVMPLAGFYGPHRDFTDSHSGTERAFPNFITEAYYKAISEAGINLITYTPESYTYGQGENIKTMLELGEKYGVGLFVTDSEVTKHAGGSEIPVETLKERIANYSVYDAFCGMYVIDEPNTSDYPLTNDGTKLISDYGKLSSILQKELDIPCYLNMYPYWTKNGAQTKESYEQYVKVFCETLQPEILMWDYYPFDADDGLDTYFYNMSVMRSYSEKNQVPFWAAIQAGGQWNDKKEDLESITPYYPNQKQFNWNVNTCLAFGVQGLNYFPLIQPIHFAYAPNGAYDFERNGLIGADGFKEDGTLNEWYYYAKDLNAHIKVLDRILMNSVHQGMLLNVKEDGKKTANYGFSTVPANNFLADFASVDRNYILAEGSDKWFSVTESSTWGVTYYTQSEAEGTPAAWREVIDVDGDAMIGCFNYNGKTALYVVNYSMEDEQTITLNLDRTHNVKMIEETKISYVNEKDINLEMTAGEGVLLVIE